MTLFISSRFTIYVLSQVVPMAHRTARSEDQNATMTRRFSFTRLQRQRISPLGDHWHMFSCIPTFEYACQQTCATIVSRRLVKFSGQGAIYAGGYASTTGLAIWGLISPFYMYTTCRLHHIARSRRQHLIVYDCILLRDIHIGNSISPRAMFIKISSKCEGALIQT